MNIRQRKLLQLLLTHTHHVFHLQDLATRLDCSEKTVRNDLNRLDEILNSYPNASLIRKPGLGIYLEIDEVDRKELLDMLLSKEPITKEDRVIEIAYQLLMENSPVTLRDLSEKYFVSKQVIKKDLETIENWVERFKIDLQTKERVGTYLNGSEIKRRIALAHLSELVPSFLKGKKYVLNLFLPYEVSVVKKTLQDLVRNFPIDFTDDALESLLVHGLIMIKRTRQKLPVTIPEDEKKVDQYPEYKYAAWFFQKLEHTLQVKFSEDERIYFTLAFSEQ